jgi:hypothetical protein
MATFTFYIHDNRYRVPNLAIVEAESVSAARAIAMDRLLQSAHHTAIDVREDECLQFSLTAADRERA